MVESDTAKYDTVVMENDSDDEERDYNFKTLYRHMHSEAKRKYVNSSCEAAKSVRNIRLNRYNNVAPYDLHRVVLSQIDGTDYINASVANSSSEPEQIYLLAQGPLNRTCFDFWRMCWEKNSKNVIMLNKLMENGRVKCARYWPEEIDHQLNFQVEDVTFSVTLLDETFDQDRFIIRKIELSRSVAGEADGTEETETKREITHFHYVAWPDFGVPDTPKDFGDFFYTLERHHCFSDKEKPSIVHCSAGIGRTGTLILVDSCLKKLRKEQPERMLELPDLIQLAYEEIIFLRQFRMGLIQTADQLEFSIRSIEYLHNDHLKSREQFATHDGSGENPNSSGSNAEEGEGGGKDASDEPGQEKESDSAPPSDQPDSSSEKSGKPAEDESTSLAAEPPPTPGSTPTPAEPQPKSIKIEEGPLNTPLISPL